MQDGFTKKVQRRSTASRPRGFLAGHRVVIVTLTGATAGNEYEIENNRTVVGRGPDVDIAFDDQTMSREHAAFEVMDDAMWLRDLGSTNHVLVNGGEVRSTELKNGDKLDLGEHQFQLLLEKRQPNPKASRLGND